MSNIEIVVAYDKNRAIGKSNEMLWDIKDIPDDMKKFRYLTMGGTVIMGRKTLESIGMSLPERRNIVVTRDPDYEFPGVEVSSSLEAAYGAAEDEPNIYVIGGGQIYEQAVATAGIIHATELDASFRSADTYFPEIDPSKWRIVDKEDYPKDDRNKYNFSFVTYERKT